MATFLTISCTNCVRLVRPFLVEDSHGRPAIRVQCPICGIQERPEIETALTPGAPSQQLIDAIGFVDRRAG